MNPEESELVKNIRRTFDIIGDPGECKGCGVEIWWIRHTNGKRAPYTERALNHFSDCPNANDFRKKK